MPIKYTLLKGKPWPLKNKICKYCKNDNGGLEPFLRGQIQSDLRRFLKLAYCAVICPHCETIIGWEKPTLKRRPF
jgi:hypothetical protein